jgi:hypothetical protein
MKPLIQGFLALYFIIVSTLGFTQTNKTPEIWSGSYSEMIGRGEIRMAVPYDLTIYDNDKGVPRVLSIEVSTGFAKWVNTKYAGLLKGKPVSIKLVPTIAPELLNSLSSGRADIAIGDIGLY